MNKNVLRFGLTALLATLAVAFTQCGKPFGEKGELTYSTNGVARSIAGGDDAVSLEAFRTTVYPMTRQHCVSCHAVSQQPVHASPDLTTAHNALVAQFKVNFSNPRNSRIVQKLLENHQCWGSCADNARQMELAIETWARDLSTSAPPPAQQYAFVTQQTQTIAQVRQQVTNNTIIASTVAASAMLMAPMVYNATAPGFISVPDSGANLTKANNDATAGVATFSIMGTGVARTNGALWGLVNAPNGGDDSFHVAMNGGAFLDWQIPVTNGFQWVKITSGANRAVTNFNLNAAANTITIREREDGAQLARLLWTQDQNFNPTGTGTAGMVTLSFSLEPKIAVPGARLEVKIEDYDAFSYRFSDIRLIVPNRYAYVKGINLLKNGQFNPQFSNYTYIEQLVNPAAPALSPANMIVLKDNGEANDRIAFAFDSLELRGDPAQSLAAFQTTVYPITRQYCVNCHVATQRPFHASATPQIAHDDLINRYMVDFQNPQSSRIVEKLLERHNCWSGNCTNDAATMRNAIQQWGQAIGN